MVGLSQRIWDGRFVVKMSNRILSQKSAGEDHAQIVNTFFVDFVDKKKCE